MIRKLIPFFFVMFKLWEFFKKIAWDWRRHAHYQMKEMMCNYSCLKLICLGEQLFHLLVSIWTLKFLLIEIGIEYNPYWFYTNKPSFSLLGVGSLFHRHFLLWTMGINLIVNKYNSWNGHFVFRMLSPILWLKKGQKGRTGSLHTTHHLG